MKEIPLTQGKVAIVDDSDYEYLMQWKWYYFNKHPYSGYAYRSINNSTRHYFMHWEVLKSKPPSGMVTDHIDGNGLNNSLSNLRFGTYSQNQCNKKVKSNTTTSFKGVTKLKNRSKPFNSNITISGKTFFLGSFSTAEEAHEAYKKAALEHHGEFAKW